MRVVAGYLGSRALESPSSGVRPTSDRVRESIFSRLGDVGDCRVLDLFAGTGALGIEAISRGASAVVFVERARAAQRILAKNLENLELGAVSQVIRGEVKSSLKQMAGRGEQFDLIFMDPPYDSTEFGDVLALIGRGGLLESHGTLVVESAKRHPLPAVSDFDLEIVDERATGDTRITRLRAARGVEMAKRRDGDASAASESSKESNAQNNTAERLATVALFPASFDPPTNGHIDLIERAREVFDEVVVAVAINLGKTGTFSFEERLEMLNTVTANMDRVRVEGFSGLVVDHAKAMGATVIIRGLRAMSDFEYEFEMALMNRHIEPDLETIFMMSRQEYLYVSSSRLKELVRFGASVDDFVPPSIAKRLQEKLGN
ncbi:MAG: pantetheine-phosphate adenylyltransferase [Myxococcales bacterium]|nr:pantetheine-phosphate adenylyltransferase [Myxococcales bacterium]